MKIKKTSYFKNEPINQAYFKEWVAKLENNNERTYESYEVTTSIGKTHVWGFNTNVKNDRTLVIFPGARTTSLIWDFDKGLDHLGDNISIFLVETNGLPNLSDGKTPDIQSLDYGHWANEVFEKLNIEKAFIAGASFGGLICMKMAITNPEKTKSAFLLNPGCLQPFSMTFKNLYFNILPIVKPNEKNVSTFLNKAVFSKPVHQLSEFSEKMLIDYEVFAISQYKDKTQKPYFMGQQLSEVTVDTYLLEGDKDLLFPYQKSIENAKKLISSLKEVKVFENVGHGIETYSKAMNYMKEKINGTAN